jgi:hypothetical protein
MGKVIAIYKVKPDRVEENEEAVRAVYTELHESIPEGFSYATFKLPDGLTFIHVAMQDSDGKSPLSDIKAFKNFQAGIKDRCDGLPAVNHVTEIGSYNFGYNQKEVAEKNLSEPDYSSLKTSRSL